MRRFVSRRMKIASVNGGASPATYLVSDDLEYANSAEAIAAGWTLSSTPLIGYNTSPAPLQGAYSFALDSGVDIANISFPAQDEAHAYFMFSPSAGLLTASRNLVYLGGLLLIHFSTTGSFRIYNGTLSSGTGSFIMTAGNTYHVWLYYKKGTGANGVSSVWINTTPTKPATPDVTRIGDATTQASSFQFGPTGGTVLAIFDKLRVKATDVGSDPV